MPFGAVGHIWLTVPTLNKQPLIIKWIQGALSVTIIYSWGPKCHDYDINHNQSRKLGCNLVDFYEVILQSGIIYETNRDKRN